MKEYNITIPNYTDFEKQLQNERDFFKYMQMLNEAKYEYLIIITAGDTPAGPLFTPNHAAAMMNALGLKINMLQAYRQPYIAVINRGNVVYEQTLMDLTKALKVNADFGDKKLLIYSGGFECTDEYGYKAVLKINDDCFYGGRGYNFFVFNAKYNYLVDQYACETFELEEPEFPLYKPFAEAEKIYSAIGKNSVEGGGYCILPLFNSPIPFSEKSLKARANVTPREIYL